MYEWYDFTIEEYSRLDNLSEKEVCESAGDGFIFAYSMQDSPRGCCGGGCCKPSSINYFISLDIFYIIHNVSKSNFI